MSVAFRASTWVLICALLGLLWLHKGVAVGAVVMGVMAVAFAVVAVWAVVIERREVRR